ncbi:hypothetical protein Slin15195_G088570 [Septoria linicola]|uniref:Uncharacterized protein n=1 Tax=Septoria linicola TaxID=215465 RepID=A0A9Q9AYH4_9PEZI|nr:hypothetical protein Slin14017_G091220 [Septoria linicola]USW55538.1 hypothetical protein Slin15195_G088570 [Septoria linicola]
MQKPDEIMQRDEIPGIVAETCDAWWQYTEDNVAEQIDSGLRKFNNMRKFKNIRML